MVTKTFTVALLAALLTLLPGVVLADDLARSKAFFKRAEMHYKLGEFTKALPLYKEAYKAKALPAFLFNIGQCHRYLGNCDKAEFFYSQFLAQVPNSPHAGTISDIIEECKPRKKQPAPPVVKPQWRPEKEIASPPRTDHSGRRKLLLWTGVGVSSALLITGAVTGALAHDRSQQFKDPATPYAELSGLEDSGKALATTSVVTLAVGGAAAAATVLIYLLYPRQTNTEARVSAVPLTGGGGLSLQGRF